MMPLRVLENSDLTDYIVKKLKKSGIETIHDLLTADENNLCQATNLTTDSFLRIKHDILKKYGSVPVRMSRLYFERKTTQKYNFAGIPRLDSMLEKNSLCESYLLEICGFVGMGKTIFCLTMAVNFATHNGEVLIINTKIDCIGSRIYQILKTRNVSKNEMGQIMQRIKIEFTLSAYGVINILKNFLKKFLSGCSAEVNNIKLIIIDSLPAAWLHFDGKEDTEGKYLLTCLANLMRKLSKEHCIAFVFVNLLIKVDYMELERKGLQIDDLDAMNDDTDIEGSYSQHSESNLTTVIKPALGKYWLSVPTMRLSLEKERNVSPSDEENIGIVRVLKSCLTPTGDTYTFRITKAGVV